MFTQTEPTPRTAPRGGTPEAFLDVIERNKGRLQVLRYAANGMAHEIGSEATCLVWIIDDILNDLEVIGESGVHASSDSSINPLQRDKNIP